MLTIRSRDELLKHLESLRDVAEEEAFVNRRGYKKEPYESGRAKGLAEAITAIEAWAEFDLEKRGTHEAQ